VNSRVRVLLVSGSLRAMSTNTAALRTAQAFAPENVDAVLYDGVRDLPHFDPDLDGAHLPGVVATLRAEVRQAHALLLSTPEYAGALPGSFKNVLDWLIGDDDPRSIYNKPVAWINASPRGAVQAHDSLRLVLGYAHAHVVDEACVDVAVTARDIGDDGLVTGAGQERIAYAIAQLSAAGVSRSDDVRE
jgi:NAD(P)H-dependent FMN reductase